MTSLSLTPTLYIGSQPTTPSQLAQQIGLKTPIPQEDNNAPMHVDWIPQDSGAKRMVRTLVGDLQDRNNMLRTSNFTSQFIRGELDRTTSQYQGSREQFQNQRAAYDQAKSNEDQGSASLESRLRPGYSLAVCCSIEHHSFGYAPYVNEQTQQELEILSNTYYEGYLHNALERIEKPAEVLPVVFRYDENLHINLPPVQGKPNRGFVSSGSFFHIHDVKARDAFPNGNYVHCKKALYIKEGNASNANLDGEERYRQVDVIITGTTDEKKCKLFKEHFLGDVAHLAATDSLESQDPYADTRVVEYTNNTLKPRRDVTPMSQATREAVLLGNFTPCPPNSLQKTRLSNEKYKEVGTIVTGTVNPDTCIALHLQEQKFRIEDKKE